MTELSQLTSRSSHCLVVSITKTKQTSQLKSGKATSVCYERILYKITIAKLRTYTAAALIRQGYVPRGTDIAGQAWQCSSAGMVLVNQNGLPRKILSGSSRP